jgi:hypothetical protein
MVNVVLVGGKFAGLKTQVPAGRKVLNIPDEDSGPKLAVVENHADVAKHMAAARDEKMMLGPEIQSLEDCDNPYMLYKCVVTNPELNDVLSFTIGCPPGIKMSDSFMEILAGYCMLCYPEEAPDA